MQIRRIRVEKFRKLVEPVEIDDLPNGLCVIGGDNEEGKSTLLEAVRAVLFEKHRLGGQGAEAMQPIGQDVAPEIELDFVFGGQDYRLRKRFVRSPEARMEGAGQVWEGDAVEDTLEDLLGFDRPGRGETSPEHHGLWGMLWVSQGTAFHRVTPNQLARDSLSGVLEEEVGEVLGGSIGQELLAHFTAERDRFWGKSGKPVKELKKALDKWEAAKQELAENQEELNQYQHRQDRLQRIEDELQHYQQENILQTMEQGLQQARDKQERLDQCQSELAEAKSALELVQLRLQSARTRWEARKTLREEMAGIDEKLVEFNNTLQARQQEAQTAEAEREAHLKRVRSAEQQARETNDAAQRLAGLLQYLDRSEKRKSLADQYEKAREAHHKAKEARTDAQAIRVTDKELKVLREMERAVDQAEGRLAGSATELTVDVNVDYEVSGEAQSREGDYLITGSAAVNLAGVGTVGIRAGGSELAGIQETLRRTRQERDDKLVELDAKSLQQAEELHSRKQALEGEIKNHEKILQVHAPEGLQALHDQMEALDVELANLPEPEGEEAQQGRPDLQQAHGEAQERRQQAQAELDKARKAHDDQQGVFQQAQENLTEARTALKGQKERQEEIRKRLEEGRAEISDEELSRRLADEQAKVESAEQRVNKAQEALNALYPEDIQLELENAEKAVSLVREEIEKLEKERDDLKGELRGVGSQGLSEKQEKLEREAREAERAYCSMQREANAVWMAAEALEEAASEARQAYLQPFVRHLNPYLSRVFTDAEPVLGDTLELQGLRRGEHVEDFGQLSVGAREQVAVLTRLAFADLLAEEGGEAPPVILDDALVYADGHRFETMKHLLSRSAQKHQILILTCRPKEYLSLGAEQFRLG